RLNLLKVLMGAPNVLILDEPTNDLDITTLTVLEDYLDSFPGIVITVSHDRYFLDRVVRRIFAFEEGGRVVQYEGGYTDYQIRKEAEGALTAALSGSDAASRNGKPGKSRDGKVGSTSGSSGNTASVGTSEEASGKKSWKQPSTKLKFSYKEQREYETIEDDIAALEEKIEQLEQEILKSARDFVKLNQLTKEKEETENALEEKMDRWMYLEDLKARIDAQWPEMIRNI
ncbi:MAG: ABC transporter ATP-binding protein, partial [Lachnospiraceae bacterium]|nr:ABC transporter ATP-binding protein [Lachnospiraceae bacterium]